ncbi:MAG: hypothetical protein ABJE95_22755 [Byssovorax sp.]
MKTWATLLLVVGLAGCADPKGQAAPVASIAVASASVVDEDAGPGDAGADASDAGDAAAPPSRPPPPPRVRTLDIPEDTKSKLPKVPEWTDTVRRDVVVRPEYTCTLQHVREWSRITCDASNATVTLVTGTRDGCSLWATRDTAQMLFPVRRGDRRVIELRPHPKLVTFEGPYGAGQSEESGGEPVVLTETWLEGEDAPTLVVQ